MATKVSFGFGRLSDTELELLNTLDAHNKSGPINNEPVPIPLRRNPTNRWTRVPIYRDLYSYRWIGMFLNLISPAMRL